MIIAVNKCPQNITLKAFNLSPEIYIYILSLFQFSQKWMGMEMGFYVPFSMVQIYNKCDSVIFF